MDIATVKKGNVKLLLTVAASSVLKSPDLHHKVSGGGYQQHGVLSKEELRHGALNEEKLCLGASSDEGEMKDGEIGKGAVGEVEIGLRDLHHEVPSEVREQRHGHHNGERINMVLAVMGQGV